MKASTTKPSAAKQAEYNIADMIRDVQPVDFEINWGATVLAVIAFSAVLYFGLSAAFTMFAAVTASAGTLAAVLLWLLGAQAALSVAMMAGYGTFFVAHQISKSDAYAVTKSKVSEKLGNAKSWFSAKRAQYA